MGVLVALVVKAFKSPNVTSIVEEQILWVSILNLLLFASVVYSGFVYANKQRQVRRSDVENAYLHVLIEGQDESNIGIARDRADVSRAHSEFCIILQDHMTRKTEADLAGQLLVYLDQVLTSTASLFSKLTGEQCAACIKIFSLDRSIQIQPAEGSSDRIPPYVFTLKRDITSALARKIIDTTHPFYKYTDNAAFRSILDDDKCPDYFVCNDLAAAGPAYFSANLNFGKFYNATIVVPIERHGVPVNTKCTGLLCVDNFGGRFDEKRCISILNGIAMDVYYSIWTASKILALES
jgi:hypothetical protein